MASGPITSWQIEGEKVEVVTDFIFLGFKITASFLITVFFRKLIHDEILIYTFIVAQTVKCLPTMRETRLQSLGWEDPLDNVGDLGSICGLRRSPGEGKDYPLQYSCLGNSIDRGAWQATVHRVAKSQI